VELRTYTGLWNVEKRLYKFYDVNLPYPVSIKQLGIGIGVLFPWIGLMNLLNVPFQTPWHVVWIFPPAIAFYFANKVVAEGKTLSELMLSQIKYYTGARVYARLRPIPKVDGQRIVVTGTAWRRPSS
jgi:hypothetical protein